MDDAAFLSGPKRKRSRSPVRESHELALSQSELQGPGLSVLQDSATGQSRLGECMNCVSHGAPEAAADTVAASTSTQLGTTGWRIAAARLHLWPQTPPSVPAYSHGWVHRGNERMLGRLVSQHRPRVSVELGSWLGMCTSLLLDLTEHYSGSVFAIDRWDAEWLTREQADQYARDTEALGMLKAGWPLYETFLVNLWERRSRLFPLRMDTLEGLRAIHDLGVPVDLIYVDANHEREAVLQDIQAAARMFPNAIICGDDWQWSGVRSAVRSHAQDCSLEVEAHARENWWRLATARVDVQRGSCMDSALPKGGHESPRAAEMDQELCERFVVSSQGDDQAT